MKTLLFVQSGDARPKVAHANCPDSITRRSGQRVRDACATRHYLSSAVLRVTWGRWAALARDADRWWLVECTHADAGRLVIWADNIRRRDGAVHGTPQGRILASGGRTA